MKAQRMYRIVKVKSLIRKTREAGDRSCNPWTGRPAFLSRTQPPRLSQICNSVLSVCNNGVLTIQVTDNLFCINVNGELKQNFVT